MATREERSTPVPGGGRGTGGSRSVRRRTVRRLTVERAGEATRTGEERPGADSDAQADATVATVTIPRQRPRPRPHPRPVPVPDAGEPDADPGEHGSGERGTGGRGRPRIGGRGSLGGPDGDGGRATVGKRGWGGPRAARGGARPALRWRLVAGALAVLLLAGVLAGGLLARRWYDQWRLDDARQSALAAARQTTVNFVSISASTVDRDLKRISDGATGEFKDEFTQDTAQVRAAVLANKVDSRGTVLRAAVVSANRRSAVVLVAVDATVKNTDSPDGRLSHYRIRVDLSRGSSGRWLVAQLQFVG